MAPFIPRIGEEASFPLAEGLTMRHGSSLKLMSTVCEFLANPVQEDSFNYVDPTADHHKWARKGLSLYYACVATSDGSIVCALRAATDGHHHDNNSQRNRPSIFLIDYVYSAPSHREKGIAGKLIGQVLKSASAHTKFVLSIEESCVYWMEKYKFFLCESHVLNERLNVFPDTHLLIHEESKMDVDALVKALEAETKSATQTSQVAKNPPQSFTKVLHDLQILGACQAGMPLCLGTLATLIQNAKNDDSKDGKRRTIRINNPQVHRRVFAVGGEFAMKLLQECGFELQVNDDGDAILRFAGSHLGWLDQAIGHLESMSEVNK